MDDKTAVKFIATLAKHLHQLCNVHIDFDNCVQITGHLLIDIDCKRTINFSINESLIQSPTESDVVFTSKSYHGDPEAAKARDEFITGKVKTEVVDFASSSTHQMGHGPSHGPGHGRAGERIPTLPGHAGQLQQGGSISADDNDDSAGQALELMEIQTANYQDEDFDLAETLQINPHMSGLKPDYRGFKNKRLSEQDTTKYTYSDQEMEDGFSKSLDHKSNKGQLQLQDTSSNIGDDHLQVNPPGYLYKCLDCGYSCTTNIRLQRHIVVTHCKEQNKGFSQQLKLNTHVKEDSRSDLYQCFTCGITFTWKKSLVRHIREKNHLNNSLSHKKEKDSFSEVLDNKDSLGILAYHCLDCGSSFKRKSHLNRHNIKFHNKIKQDNPTKMSNSRMRRLFNCLDCGYSFKRKSVLKRHILTVHIKIKQDNPTKMRNNITLFNCWTCGKLFSSDSNLKSHLKVHSISNDLFHCLDCGQSFPRKSSMTRHITETHLRVRRQRRYFIQKLSRTCGICGCSVEGVSSFRRHMLQHNDADGAFKCTFCKNRFTTESHCELHVAGHNKSRKIQCEICGDSFRDSSALRIHQLKHAEVVTKPHVCDICGKSFIDRFRLRDHLKVHSIEKKLKCKMCEFRTHWSHSLIQHERRVHSDDKPYVCQWCGSGFSASTCLSQHVKRVHTKEDLVQCDICSKTFTNKTCLSRHQVVHTGERKFQCSHCDAKYTQRTDLNRHNKKVHSHLFAGFSQLSQYEKCMLRKKTGKSELSTKIEKSGPC